MSRPKQPSGLTRFFRHAIGRLLGYRPGPERGSQGHTGQRRLKFESLEGRQLLASDLASLTGLVTLGTPATPVVGATVNLYADDGDGIFEPGVGAGLDGAATADTTDGTGAYRFDGLLAGNYWIEQPAQSVGGTDLGQFVSSLIAVSVGQAGGAVGTTIDDFTDAVAQTVTADSVTPLANGSADHAGAVGGERDMIVALTSGGAGESVTLDSQAARLQFSSTLSAQGNFSAIYDGTDDDGDTLAATGLSPRDLTAGGANSVKVRVQADQAGAILRVRVYTSATNYSDSSIAIPGDNNPVDEVLRFNSDFALGAGAAGPATFTNVGAIELFIDTNTNGTDGLVTLLGAFAPTVLTQNIDNQADLSLVKTVDDGVPDVGQNVLFTITVSNDAGFAGATGVEVTDLLPAGLEFVSSNPSQGTYTAGTGLWVVGAVDAGESQTLEIVATVRSSALLTNTATITAADQTDPDSADLTDSETVDAPVAADLSLVITPPSQTPNIGQDATITVTLTNDGPDAATNVVVTDVIPAGLTLQTSTPAAGTTYASNVWTIPSLASGANVVLTLVVRATGTALQTYSSQVTASDLFDPDSTPNDGVGDDSDSATLDAPAAADLSLVITPPSQTPNIGQDATITVTLTNGGPDAATNVVVTDVIPAGLTLQSSTPAAGTTYASNVWTIPTLASGANVVLTLVVRATSSAQLTYSSQVTASDQFDSDSTPNDGAGDDSGSATIDTPTTADLSLAITPPSQTPNVGQDATITVTLTNGGPDAATGIVVTDVIPAGLTLQSSTPAAGTTYASNVWTIPTLASGANVVLTLVVRATSSAPLSYTSQVTASGVFDPDSTPNDGTGDDSAAATIDATAAADLSLVITPPSQTPNIGQDATITVTLTNGGPDAATGIVVTDVIPAGLTLQSSTPAAGTTYASNVWTIPTLASGANVVLTLVVRATSSAVQTYSSQVTASGVFDPDSTPNDGAGDDSASAIVDAPTTADLSLAITPPSQTPNVGQDATITITLTNGGPDAATGIVVTDVIPAGLTLQSSTPAAGTTYASNVWTIPTLASGANVVLTLVVRATSSAPLSYTSQVTASGAFDPDSTPNDGTGDDSGSTTIDAPAAADLSLAITPPSQTPNIGQDATITVTLTNGGPDAATGIVVTDVIPAGLTLQSSTPAAGTTYASNVWTIPTLASGANVVLTLVVRATSSAAQTYTSQVTASGVFDPDSTPNDGAGDDRATATIDAPAAADLSVTITPSSATPNFGSNVTYTITVANAGPDQATGVVVNDLLPAGLVFVSSTPSQGNYTSGTGVWTVGAINSGASATLSLVARVNTTAAVDNAAQVTASGVADPDSTPNDNTGDDRAVASIDAPAAADLRLAKTVSAPFVNVGQQVTFRLTLSNDGPDQATGVSVSDALAAGLTFVSATASQGTYDSVTGIWTVGSVNSGASVTLDIVATLATAGSKTNTAQVTASGVFDPDSTPNDNTGDDRATVSVGTILLSKRRFLAR